MMHRKIFRYLLLFVLGVLLTACMGENNEFLGIPLTQSTPIPTTTPAPTMEVVTPQPEEPETPNTEDDSVSTLLLWVPPFMNPGNGSSAGQLLQAKLDAFVAQNPNVEIVIRVKDEEGTASLIESLTAVSAVAPLELPSLVILDRTDLETAAKKGLILPMGDYSTVINNIGWFQFARSLSVIGDSSYGLPLVGEALVMVVRETEDSVQIDETPDNSNDVEGRFAFWQNDPEAAFLLNDYMAAGGQFVDDENNITLSLEELITLYEQFNTAQEANQFYSGLAEITSHAEAWEIFKANEVDMVVVPSFYPLIDLPEDAKIVPMKAVTEFDHTLATGWTVALADPLPERRGLAVALAESLTEVDFMGQWSEELNLLPVRGEAFDAWQSESVAQRFSVILLSADIYPSQETIQVVSPALQAGLTALLTEGVTPEEAAQIAIDALTVEE